jgi:hypothetical protein
MPNTFNTYSLIQTVNLTGTGSISFTSIPQIYTDLKIIVSAKSSDSNDELALKFNGGNNYVSAYQRLNGYDGASYVGSASTSPTAGFVYGGIGFNGQSGWGCCDLYIGRYTDTGPKSIHGYGANKNSVASLQSMSVVGGTIASVGAITQIDILSVNGATLISGSTASLYGIAKY